MLAAFRRKVNLGTRAPLELAIVLALVSPACGRIGFQQQPVPVDASPIDPGVDAGDLDSAVPDEDASPFDAAIVDASDLDAAPSVDAWAPVDAPADAPPDAPPRAYDACVEIPFLPTAPTIDGQLEPGLALTPVPSTWWNGAMPVPAAHRTAYAVAWRADALYVFVSVEDPDLHPAPPASPVWCGDAVEVYVDSDGAYATSPMYDVPGTRQLLAAAPVDSSTPSTRGAMAVNAGAGGQFPWTGSFGVFPTPTGYALEATVGASELQLATWSLAAGAHIGFDLGLNVSNDTGTPTACGGSRMGQYFLNVVQPFTRVAAEQPFASVAAFCRPVLLAP